MTLSICISCTCFEKLLHLFQAEFVNAMFDVAGNINGLNLNDTEIGLLSAVILATPG
jgi:hypothetical protein